MAGKLFSGVVRVSLCILIKNLINNLTWLLFIVNYYLVPGVVKNR
jgi:hypothetical protein